MLNRLDNYEQTYKIRFSDLDINLHLTSTAYFNYAIEARLMFWEDHNGGIQEWDNYSMVMFRQEAKYFKEVRVSETIKVNLWLKTRSKEYHKLTFINEIYKSNNELAAIITTDCGVFDPKIRKIVPAAEPMRKIIDQIPLHKEFQLV